MLEVSTHTVRGGPRVRGCLCVELVRSRWNDLELQQNSLNLIQVFFIYY